MHSTCTLPPSNRKKISTNKPTSQPTKQPINQPASQPASQPTNQPNGDSSPCNSKLRLAPWRNVPPHSAAAQSPPAAKANPSFPPAWRALAQAKARKSLVPFKECTPQRMPVPFWQPDIAMGSLVCPQQLWTLLLHVCRGWTRADRELLSSIQHMVLESVPNGHGSRSQTHKKGTNGPPLQCRQNNSSLRCGAHAQPSFASAENARAGCLQNASLGDLAAAGGNCPNHMEYS